MALTGILFRRDTKANLKLEQPIEGEVVYATDTKEYGATVGNSLIWKPMFTGPGINRVLTIQEMEDLQDVRTNDFCFVEETNKIYNFFNNNWTAITEIDDFNIELNKTWSSEKISSYKINGNNRIVSLKNSTTSGVIPSFSSLDNGELFVNVTDAKVFFKKTFSGASSLIELTNSRNSFFDNTYFDSQLNQTINSELSSTNIRDAIYELSLNKAPKVNAQLTTPNIGIATGTSFNGLTGLSTVIPPENTTLGAIGTSTTASRADHSHPGDPFKAPVESPVFQNWVKAPYFWSTTTTGTAPMLVNSTTKVNNLNADLLDDQDSLYYRNSSNINAGILSAAYGGTGVAGTLTGVPFVNGTAASTVATSAQILNQIQGSKTGTGVFALSDSPVFTTTITTPRITNDIWCINSFAATSSSLSNVNISLVPASEMAGGEFQIVVSEGSGENLRRHHTRLVYVLDGLNIYTNEESQIFSDVALATFDVQIISGILTIVITPATVATKTYKIKTSSIRS